MKKKEALKVAIYSSYARLPPVMMMILSLNYYG